MAFRRRRPLVLVIAGLVVAVLVIVVLALPGSDSSSDQQSYLDIVRPQLQLSAQQGAVVRDIRANARSLDRLTLVQRVNDLVGAAAGVQRQVAPVSPPGSLGSAGSLLEQAMNTRAQGTIAVLGLARQLTVSVVVANTGNATEHEVPVVATVSGGQPQSARTVVNLEPGQRQALDLGGLSLGPRTLYVLTVTVGPVSGDPTPADNSQTMPLIVAG